MPWANAAFVTVCWARLIDRGCEYFPLISVPLYRCIDPPATALEGERGDRQGGRQVALKTSWNAKEWNPFHPCGSIGGPLTFYVYDSLVVMSPPRDKRWRRDDKTVDINQRDEAATVWLERLRKYIIYYIRYIRKLPNSIVRNYLMSLLVSIT